MYINIFSIILIILLIVYSLFNKIKLFGTYEKVYVLALILLHYTAFFLNYKYSLDLKKDAYSFYINSVNSNNIFEYNFTGSKFMSVIIYPLVKSGLTFFTISLVFASISFFAFINYFHFLVKNYNIKKSKMLLVILALFLMPSLHFWTAGLTKEALVFYLMSIVFFNFINKKNKSVVLVMSFILILLIRPYLFAIIFFSYVSHILINSKALLKNKLILIAFSLLTLILCIPVLKDFLRIDRLNLSELRKIFHEITIYSQNNGESSIDLQNSSYLGRLFLVLFRPLFYDVQNIYQYLISMENLINLLVLIRFLYDFVILKVRSLFFKKKIFIWLTVIILITFYSSYLYNLGLASRMRIMFIPYLYLSIYIYYAEIKTGYEKE